MLKADPAAIRGAKRRDRVARWLITLGGVTIIASVIAIVVLIVSVVVPLFRGARAEVRVAGLLPDEIAQEDVLGLGIDFVELGDQAGGDSLTAYCLTRQGTIAFLEPGASDPASGDRRWTLVERVSVAAPAEAAGPTVCRVERSEGAQYTLLWSDGSVSLVKVAVVPEFDELGRRRVRSTIRTAAEFPPDGTMPRMALARATEGGAVCVRLADDDAISIVRQTVKQSLLGAAEKQTRRRTIRPAIPGAIRALTMDRQGDTLFAGTDNGILARWRFDGSAKGYRFDPIRAFRDQRAIESLAMVFGQVSLAVGDARGNLTTWSEVRTDASAKRAFRPIHRLTSHAGAIRDLVASQRDKSLLSLGDDGTAHLDYATSQKHLLELVADHPLRQVGYSPRGNAVIGLTDRGALVAWAIDSPHPEISWGTLFGRVHYDNHDEPKYMWQSSGTHEPKFSLVPVIFGTFKSTIYAMLFAVPLALFGAMYVSHFTTPAFKRTIKPLVEIMAAVPSVVIGFLILLWAAPLMGRWIVAVFAALLTLPAAFIAFMFVWQLLRRFDWAKRFENGYEFLVLVPVLLMGATLAAWLAAPLENALFAGSFPQWLADTVHTPYEQLNSLVVAFGLGFAVIPIIFSISEDSLSDIPHSLTAASLALGASRWQTVWRVILPSASPGIFAAVMIGFGRAVGETMIVFMATGNTPILDWNPFNGFRTLSANIAVEISEAPRGGTLYRVLFLCAVLLFLLTFLLNTVAELVRQHLRKKYGRY